MNLKIGQLRLSILRNRKRKGWRKIKPQRPVRMSLDISTQAYDGSLSMRGRGKNGRKSIWRYNGQNFSEFDQNVNLHVRGCSSVVEHLLCMYEALGSIPGISRSDLSCCSDGKESACHAGDPGLICGLERASGEGHGNPLQCSCLENSMGRGAWGATVHGVTESGTTEQLTLHLQDAQQTPDRVNSERPKINCCCCC